MSILGFLDRLMSGAREAGAPESVDVEADAIIRAFFKRNPDAAYHLTKLAMALAAQKAPLTPEPSKSRNWFAALLERRTHFAS